MQRICWYPFGAFETQNFYPVTANAILAVLNPTIPLLFSKNPNLQLDHLIPIALWDDEENLMATVQNPDHDKGTERQQIKWTFEKFVHIIQFTRDSLTGGVIGEQTTGI